MALRNYSNTATEATLTGGVTTADTSIALASFSGFPVAPFTAVIDRATASEEIVLVTAVSGSTVTATRGYDGTTAKTHAAGAQFLHVTVAKDYTEANAHVQATSGAHGVSGPLVGTTDVQTLTNKTLTSPVLQSPSATGTSAFAAGTFSGTLSVTGATTLASFTAASGSVTGNLTVGGTLTASGAANVSGALSAGSVSVTGTSTFTGAATFSGTATVQAPTLGGHAVTKTYADALGVATPTVSTIVRRDAAGRFQAVDPSASADVATKNYVDGKFSDSGYANLGLAAGWTGTSRIRVKNGVVYWQATLSRASWASGTTVATLPVGQRPGEDTYVFGTWANQMWDLGVSGGTGVIQVNGPSTSGGGLVISGSWPL